MRVAVAAGSTHTDKYIITTGAYTSQDMPLL